MFKEATFLTSQFLDSIDGALNIIEYGSKPDKYSIKHEKTVIELPNGNAVETDAGLLEAVGQIREAIGQSTTINATYVVDSVATRSFKI